MTTLMHMPRASLRRFSVAEYHSMIQSGILTEADPVELLDGWIVKKMPRTPPHDATIDLVKDAVERLLPDVWRLRIQSAVTLDESEPEPDLAVVRGPARRYVNSHPTGRDIAMVIEVASSSLDDDREVKRPIYAAAGIPAYWIVNLVDARVEVFTHPNGATYATEQQFGRAESIPLTIDGSPVSLIPVSDLLP